jgi:hypothetical protein
VRHDVDDDSLAERDLYESPDPMILIRKMINTKNKNWLTCFQMDSLSLVSQLLQQLVRLIC